jgi:hypothetical protein
MKLRRTDVETLRSELSGGEVVELGEPTEELVFEDDTDLDAGMATEEISEADTLVDGVEDVGSFEIEVEETVETPATRRRTTTTTATAAGRTADAAPEEEPMGLRAVMIGTSFVMILALPVCMAAASGHVTGVARAIAGIFGEVP